MNWSDEEFEAFLRQFQPQKPKALPAADPAARLGARWWLAAAVILLGCGTALWVSRSAFLPEAEKPAVQTDIARPAAAASAVQTVTLGRLTQLAHGSSEQLDVALNEASRSLLPDVERNDSTLHGLARE